MQKTHLNKKISLVGLSSILCSSAFIIALSETNGAARAQESGGVFSVTFSNGISFDHNSEKARVLEAGPDTWQFKGKDRFFFPQISIEARGLSDAPQNRTTDISEGGYNDRDLRIYFTTSINGERTHLVCQSASIGTGWIERTMLTETHVAGSFSIEATECHDKHDAAKTPIPYEGLPITVSGEFSLEICGLIHETRCNLN